MRARLPARGGWSAHQTAALAREIVLGAPVADVTADALFAHPVVDRRVDVIDAGIQHGVENGLRLLVRHVAATRCSTQLHRAVAQHRDLQSSSSESPLR